MFDGANFAGEAFYSGWLIHSPRTAIALTFAFALLARFLRGVTTSGAIAGAVICFIFYTFIGPGGFAILILVFVLTWVATRFGYRQKEAIGKAEKRGGRTASQVIANLGVAAFCAWIYGKSHLFPYLLAFCAALAEAAADTLSSELGKASGKHPRLITNWKPVPVGANGGVTLLGTLAGIIGAIVVSWGCVVFGLLNWSGFVISTIAAAVGMCVDSILGAELENHGFLNNDGVNLIGTFSAAGIAQLYATHFL